MKASPVRPGDRLTFLAEIELLGALSACPGGDCSAEHSSDAAACHPLRVEVLTPEAGALDGWAPPPSMNTTAATGGERAFERGCRFAQRGPFQAKAASSAISTIPPKPRSRSEMGRASFRRR